MLHYMIQATFTDVFAFPPTAILFMIAGVVAVISRSTAERPLDCKESLLLAPLVIVAYLIVHGTVFHRVGPPVMESTWQSTGIGLCLLLHLLLCGLIVWQLKGLRVYAIAVLCMLSCFTLAAAIEAEMSVTNLWL